MEGEEMRIVAERARKLLLELPRCDAEVFWPGYDEGDGRAERLQCERAELWLRARPALPSGRVALGLRTDAGDSSRVTGFYRAGGAQGAEARGLAHEVARSVARALGGRRVRLREWEGPGVGGPCVWAVVECGARRNKRDAEILLEEPDEVAWGVRAGLEGYLARQARPDLASREGLLLVGAPGDLSRREPSLGARVTRPLAPGVYATDGYTERGQRVAGSSRWYRLAGGPAARWVHASVGRYLEPGRHTSRG
jgi:hypothetical protein